MNGALADSGLHERENDRLDLLVGRFLRILNACGVREEDLNESLQRIAKVRRELSPTNSLDASASLHLASTDIVFHWRRFPPFIDSKGRPKRLRVSGSEDSFDELVRRTSPGIDARVVLSYLEQLGALRKEADGLITLATDSVLACSKKGVSSSTVLTHIQAFLSSVEYNLLDRHEGRSARFERACYGKIPDRLVPILERLVEVRGQNLIDSIDEWLARHATGEDEGKEVWLAGAGAYVFAHPSNIFEKQS